ncbi:unnamed protein product [Cuscuta campestris]|uniref:Transposase (Putative), gypsy type n=1 Tax=Cuscuta campestris TaxID=132261 RepID=A0A484MT79_9ASTE|nr:unnamed protein product [Cuscuta campestris]
MALCHCQITDRGFADATNMVGPSIEVIRPTSTQTALDAPSGFFTVHLASLKKELQFPLHSLLIEFLNEVDLLPCQLVPKSHRYIASYLVRCKKVGVKSTLDHFLFTFKLAKGLPSFRRVPCPPSNATLLSITWKHCGQGAIEIKKVVTEESLAALGFEFVQDEHRHHPDLLRDALGGSVDCGPFVEPLEKEMDDELLIGQFVAGRKRKRDATRQRKSKRSSSRGEDSPPREKIVIEVEDRNDVAPEMGATAISSPPRSLMLGGDLARSSQGAFSERPPSPPVVIYEVATEGRSMRFSIPPPSPSLGDVQLETLVTLPAQDRARISASSEDDLNNMVLLKLSQATLGMIEIVGWRQDRQAVMDEARKATEDKQKELQEEVARLAKELEEEKGRSANLVIENTSLSSEVGSVSARVTALEGEKADLFQQLEAKKSDQARRLEEAIESFKSSPEFTAVAMERMNKLVVEWLNTGPGARWMVKESEKSFNCGLF